MFRSFRVAAVAAVVLGAASAASAQTSVFNFEDGTDQGWGVGFGNDASRTLPIVNIGGSNRMQVARTGSFQETGREVGADGSPFFLAMQAAAANEAGYILSYDWYVDTSTFAANPGTFFQMGSYVNSGSGYYAQYFPGTGKEVELNGTQLASGQVFQGTVSLTFAERSFDIPAGETFYRIGLILNGDTGNSAQNVFIDNVTVTPIPEPAAASLLAGLPLLAMRRRRA